MEQLLKKLGIKPNNIDIYKTAFTHSSYANELGIESYERLEFLGDAIIELLTSEYLYLKSEYKEGDMTKTRAKLVKEEALVFYCDKLKLSEHISLGKSELQKGSANKTIKADVVEALFGAMLLDLGFEKTKEKYYQILVPFFGDSLELSDDYKTELQELMQLDKRTIVYKIISERGPSHDKTFEAEVEIDDIVLGRGTGRKKQSAEQNAALDALKKCARRG
ncbi:MAG: ribonuclease III [Acholeplasmatales bacterium]|jgi:ribonuclease-3|nr:ribonuclease III [Acholeplasmatales bacterium]